MKTSAKKIKKVLFYTGGPKLFRATLIGHLYEISRAYPTILLSERLDEETDDILRDKKLFPGLQIVPIRSYWGSDLIKIIRNNAYIRGKIKRLVENCKPDAIIAPSDMNRLELYLMRFGKKIGALNLCVQASLQGDTDEVALASVFINAYNRKSKLVPMPLKIIFSKFKKYLGHLFYYFFLPLLALEPPFLGKSSFVLLKGNVGMRDADYYAVFSQRDIDICVKDGVPVKKLRILAHPLLCKTAKKFFERAYDLPDSKKKKSGSRTLTVMYPSEETGFEKGSLAFIPKKELIRQRAEIIKIISEALRGWKVFIKPHPAAIDNPEGLEETARTFRDISDRIKVVNPLEPADKYIKMSDVIVGMPPSSTSLFTASLQSPDKIILSLDFGHQLLGDIYRDFEGIEYVDSEQKFKDVLVSIGAGSYRKSEIKKPKIKEYSGITELLECLSKK